MLAIEEKLSRAVATSLLVATLLAGCATRSPAPVVDRKVDTKPVQQSAPVAALRQGGKTSDARPDYHEVQKGETLYSIAFQHGVDYRELAQWNGLEDPNVLRMGQRLRLTAPEGVPIATPVVPDNGVVVTPLGGEPPSKPVAPSPASTAPLKTEPKAVKQPYSDKALAQLQGADKPKPDAKAETKMPEAKAAAPGEDNVEWIWPTKGKPKVLFTEATKGIDIPGSRGQPITAAAGGKVIHVGGNLRGYGKLVIIQHSSMFLSAYAHNNQILVKEGERVARGQKIAEMGDTDTDQVKLHFEIRRFGKPVDPLKYLPGEKTS